MRTRKEYRAAALGKIKGNWTPLVLAMLVFMVVCGITGATTFAAVLVAIFVILPIEVKVDLGRHWKLALAVIPGIHWSGSHTGLRRDITSGDDETNIKDFSVNPYINPYKLDARISVQYHSIGLYFQASMLSAFKGSCDELFPVKFGIIL